MESELSPELPPARSGLNVLRRLTPAVRIVPRAGPSNAVWYRLSAIFLGIALGALYVELASTESRSAFEEVWKSTLGSGQGVSNVLSLAAALMLTGLAAAIPLRMGLWNIGAEGQLFMGAWAAAGVSFALDDLSGAVLIPVMIAASAGAGAAWALVPALARAYLGVNEIITTLLLNFVAVLWLAYWVTGAWAEPLSQGGIKSREIPEQSKLALVEVGNISVHWGILLSVTFAGIAALVFRTTTFGYQVAMLESGSEVGRYAGMYVRRRIVHVFVLGGAMAGVAGAVEMMGSIFRYSDSLSNNTGYSGIVVAVLAGGSALLIIPMAALFAGLMAAGNALRTVGVSSNAAFTLMGVILLLAAIGNSMARYRIVYVRRDTSRARQGEPGSAPSGESRDGL